MSRTIFNPNGKNSFTSLVVENYFVDKTVFIGKTIERLDSSDRKLIAFTRPRRFGKTVTAHMLASFYSKGADTKNIFSRLNIATDYKKGTDFNYEEYLNKFDVIYWDLNSIKGDFTAYQCDASLHIEGIDDLVDYLQFITVLELKQNREFEEKISNNPLIGKKSLKQALVTTQNKFVLIMDEWDLIYRDYREDEQLQKKFIDLLTGLFKAYDGLECFSLVYLTGILPIKKYNSESALNNFEEFNMLSPEPYEEYLGFTEEEVEKTVNKSDSGLSLAELKEWYDGYRFNGKDIYNPNSVALAIKKGKCRSFWSGTSSNEEIIRLINMNFDGIKDDILNMIAGSMVEFDFETFQNDLVSIDNKDQALSLLVCLGYLGCINAGDTQRLAFVPNKEIRSALNSIVRKQHWYNSLPIIERSEKLFQAIKNCDAETVAQIIENIHNSTYVSVLGYNREEALIFCLIAGLMWSIGTDYECYREVQSGAGFVDLVYVPKIKVDLPVLLIEFKRDAGADAALKQIKENNYVSRYCSDRADNEVVMIGLSYNSKTKEHQCVIESLVQ